MKSIVASCFGVDNKEFCEYLDQMMIDNKLYMSKFKIKILMDKEVEQLEFLMKSFQLSGIMPTKVLFLVQFDELKTDEFDSVPIYGIEDFRVHINNLIVGRINKRISKEMSDIQMKISDDGMSEVLKDRLDTLYRAGSLFKAKDIEIDTDYKRVYEEKLLKPAGMIFNVKDLDDRLGGLNEGTITTIAGYTSHFKTTAAINLAYYNSYYNGYNIVYLSFETPKEDMYWNLLSRHSYEIRFNKFNFISHDKIRKCILTDAEKDYVFDVIDMDIKKNSKGKIIFLDEGNFETLSFTEFTKVFEKIDEQLNGNLDGFIVDYVQLLKFADAKMGDDNRAVNAYVSFFRKISQNFDGYKGKKKLIGVLLSQINRDSWKRAMKNNGAYDLTCLADANELERGSHRVITTYTNEKMKESKEASVQILKNRGGATMWEPSMVYADGEAYVFGGEDGNVFSGPAISFSGADIGNLMSDDVFGSIGI